MLLANMSWKKPSHQHGRADGLVDEEPICAQPYQGAEAPAGASVVASEELPAKEPVQDQPIPESFWTKPSAFSLQKSVPLLADHST
jgi:hypothetical protein